MGIPEFSVQPEAPAPPQEILAYMLAAHHPRLALACSFQKEETMLLDMLLRLQPDAQVFAIDTGVLFPETYATWRALEAHYGIHIIAVDARARESGEWSAANCCGPRKVAALERALAGLSGWITGLRRAQSPTRAAVEQIEFDSRHRLWKANPLAYLHDHDIWKYIHRHGVPHNPLHDQGYDSIGCAPCTVAGQGREGRWAGSEQTECGIHSDGSVAPAGQR